MWGRFGVMMFEPTAVDQFVVLSKTMLTSSFSFVAYFVCRKNQKMPPQFSMAT